MLTISGLLKHHDLTAKKSLGQNFLVDDNIARKIVNSLEITPADTLVEIGPGVGSLTRFLAKSGAQRLIIIEKDPRFLPILEELKSQSPLPFDIHIADALDISLSHLVQGPFKVISNLPYNVGTRLLVSYVENDAPWVQKMTFMMQKEVIARLKAAPKTADYGRLSILVQRLYDVQVLCDAPPQAFIPRPKVTSSVAVLTPLKEPLGTPPLDVFKRLTALAFQGRRKMLKTTLKKEIPEISEILTALNIPLEARPEELSVLDFCRLAEKSQISF